MLQAKWQWRQVKGSLVDHRGSRAAEVVTVSGIQGQELFGGVVAGGERTRGPGAGHGPGADGIEIFISSTCPPCSL